MKTIEIKIRPVTRYIVTAFTRSDELGCKGFSESFGEFSNKSHAGRIANAIVAQEAKDNPDFTVKLVEEIPA